MRKIIVALCLIALALNGCGPINNVANSISGVGGVVERTDTIGARLARGAGYELTSPVMRERIGLLILDVLSRVDTTGNAIISRMGSNLIIKVDSLRDAITGYRMRGNLDSLLETVLGRNTRLKIQGILGDVEGTVSDMNIFINNLKDTAILHDLLATVNRVLDSTTQDSLLAFIKDASNVVGEQIGNVRADLRKDLSFLQKNVTWILIALGAVAISIIAFVWWQKRKYARLTQLLTLQIHDIPNKAEYNQLTANISKKAKESGLESSLRSFLKDQGILGDDARKVVTGER